MNVLICTDSFYPGIGGTEAACLGYGSELVKQGNNVMLVAPYYSQKDDRTYDFEIIRVPSLALTKNDKMVLVGLSGSAKKKMREFKPDIIHAETVSGMARIALKLGKELGVPVVMTIHTQFRDAFSRSIKSKLIVRCMLKNVAKKLNRADAVVTVVRNMKSEISSWGYKGEIKVIRNGAMFEKRTFSDEVRLNIRKELGLKCEDNVMIFVGRMMKYKNVEFVLNALKTAKENGLEFKFLMVGIGEDLGYFKEVAKKNGLDDNMIYLGQVEGRQKMAEIYASSDLFVTASTFDTDPIVVVEAACVGVPSLVIEGSGCSTRVENNETGYTGADDVVLLKDKGNI